MPDVIKLRKAIWDSPPLWFVGGRQTKETLRGFVGTVPKWLK